METKDDNARHLRDRVLELDAIRAQQDMLRKDIEATECKIHDLAINRMHLVPEPQRWKSSQFVCGGKVVQLSIGEEPIRHRSVQLYEIGSLPVVAEE